MGRFPGYTPEKRGANVTRMVAQTIGMDRLIPAYGRWRDLRESRHNIEGLLKAAFPLLREHAQDLAIPTEIPNHYPLSKPKVEAGWIVKSANGAWDYQSSTGPLYILTENGMYGAGTKVNRGVPALSLYGNAADLKERNLITPEHFRNIPQNLGWQAIEGCISNQLATVDVEFHFDGVNP